MPGMFSPADPVAPSCNKYVPNILGTVLPPSVHLGELYWNWFCIARIEYQKGRVVVYEHIKTVSAFLIFFVISIFSANFLDDYSLLERLIILCQNYEVHTLCKGRLNIKHHHIILLTRTIYASRSLITPI